VELTRRDFLKLSGASAAVAGSLIHLTGGSARAVTEIPLRVRAVEGQTICCYCSVGCGAIVRSHEKDGEPGKTIYTIEGDPEHPISEGSLCPKGQAMAQVHLVDGEINPYRLTKPLYRAKGATPDSAGTDGGWREMEWTEAIDKIARLVKDTRDQGLVEQEGGKTVNRNEKMASLGGGELDNEECYLLAKMNRALGVAYLEHCARI
jgi:formate dehydrogenase major subunit